MISAPEVMLVLTQLPFSSLAKTENYHKTDEQKNDKRKRVADSLMTALNSTTGILYPFFGIIEVRNNIAIETKARPVVLRM